MGSYNWLATRKKTMAPRDVFSDQIPLPVSFSSSDILFCQQHFHRRLEIVFVKEGAGVCYVDGKRWELGQGDALVCFPHQLHRYENVETGLFYILEISPEILVGVNSLLERSLPRSPVCHLGKDSVVEHLIDQLCSFQGESGTLTRSTGYANILADELIRRGDLQLVKINPEIQSTLRKILIYCEQHYREPLNLDKIAETVHLSKFYVSHLMGEKLNLNLKTYLNMLRATAARTLLSTTDMQIRKIAKEVGFGSVRSMNRAFAELLHTTPMGYRKANSTAT